MKIVLFAPSDAYLYNFRGALAAALRAAGNDVLLISPPGPFGQRFLEEGFRWLPAPLTRTGVNPVRELATLFWLYRLLRRERADLVHGFVIKGAVYGALAGKLARVPARVASITGLGYVFLSESLKARFLRVLVSWLFRLSFSGEGVRVVVQNQDDHVFFQRSRLAPEQALCVIPGSGVSGSKFYPAEPVNQSEAPFRVLLPGRLLWHKGVGEFAQAAKQLKSEGRNIEFLLAGEPDDVNPTAIADSVLAEWQSDGQLQHLGYVENMPSLMRSVDAVVLPSYREGLPKVLVEAALCALPTVTCDVPGCREVVRDQLEGFLVPAGDSQALASAIGRLEAAPELGRMMGKSARARALARFEEKVIIQGFFAVYAELNSTFSESIAMAAEVES